MTEFERGLVGKLVLITKTDGYQKRGTLLELTPDFAKLKYNDGTEIVIPVMQISQITLDVESDIEK